MLKNIKEILQEPLFHFLILGALLYIYYATVGSENKEMISISSQETKEIKLNYQQKHNRAISQAVLQAKIISLYKEKVFLQEAVSQDLLLNNKQASQLLIQQMKYILANSVSFVEPKEEELYAYYKQNILEYSHIKKISFSHIYFSPLHTQETMPVYKLLDIAHVSENKAVFFGDDFAQSNYINNMSYEGVVELFGKYFARKLYLLQSNVWHKAIHSKLGEHIVFIRNKEIGSAFAFDEVQERVYEDYIREERDNVRKSAYRNLLKKYSMQLE